MKKVFCLFLSFVCLSLLFAPAGVRAADKKGCSDPKLFPVRVPGYQISDCKTREFDAFTFPSVGKGPKTTVEGKFSETNYGVIKDNQRTSEIAIIRNYENAIKKIGGTTSQNDSKGTIVGKIVKDGKEVWVQVWTYGGSAGVTRYNITIVEKAAMEQHVVADAASFSNDIKSTGHTAVYGIYFDTGKSVIKPGSDAAMGEIARLMKSDPGLKVNVVGHTDNVGGMDSNMKLSQSRADAVVKALTGKYGIAAARMKAYGVSSLAPVASNDTEDGRAKNRRVELVKQ
jgi:OOP family OmpA-OmpF porin